MRFLITIIIIALLPIIGIIAFVMHCVEKSYDYKKRHHVSK